ncbi:hypothetical protein D8M04_06160 [Oceanobacillus piezotolerans]|uniref:Uncharacterized protein n=1 Tax=Oceanobacillus piezotolerans TaxID=2448030 RepID=A0A498D8Q9_9BACI|nr:hypothetical protein [Oceanobacillus piezotolerans]RLL46783.1 hypothetical protein D8M04_06160 [Oceanobacillus piezotolerans]
MHANHFKVQLNKKHRTLKAEELIIYNQSKIIAATDVKGSYYYLVFYKDQYINGVKANKIRLNSFIHLAFKNGISFSGTHPLTNRILATDQPFRFVKFNALINTLHKSYSMKEVVFIFIFFDSFIKQDSSKKLLKDTFYHFRRNGKNYKSYQILKTYLHFFPKDKFAYDMVHNIAFQRYETMYQQLDLLYEKDPTYVEAVSYDFHLDPAYAIHLFQLYQTQNRSMDKLAIRLAMLKRTYSSQNLAEIEESISSLSIKDQILIFKDLLQKQNHPLLQEKLFSRLLENEDSNSIASFLMEYDFQPTNEQISLVLKHIDNADARLLAGYFNSSSSRLVQLSNQSAHILGELIKPFVSAFLQEYEVKEVIAWCSELRTASHRLPIEQKLAKMEQLRDDPDNQLTLGELYLDLHQLEKSIECFKWEMELHPENPKPVSYLSKVYKQLGKKEEAKAYQQLFVQMNK